MSFAEITPDVIRNFCSTRYSYGESTKGPMSSKRLKATMTAFKAIWNFIVKEMEWQDILEPPFEESTDHINNLRKKVSKKLTKADMTSPETIAFMRAREEELHRKNAREVILFRDYLKGLDHLDPFFRPSIELAMLTGMIASEIAGLRDESIADGVMSLRWSIVDKVLKDHLKTGSRIREIPVTRSISRVLEEAKENRRDDDIFLYTTKSGLPFYDKPMREAWESACKLAEIRYVSPYSFRHSFCAYCEMMDIPKPTLIGLMGHADKSMIDTRYGKYVTGLEKDIDAIKAYFGEDFWNWKRPRD